MIPNLELGQIYKGTISGRVWVVYWNEEVNKIGLRLEGSLPRPTDTSLHLCEWDKMALQKNKDV